MPTRCIVCDKIYTYAEGQKAWTLWFTNVPEDIKEPLKGLIPHQKSWHHSCFIVGTKGNTRMVTPKMLTGSKTQY